MRETGEEFEVSAAGEAGERYVLRPVLHYGRAGSRPAVRPWSFWSYELADRTEIEAVPVARGAKFERPERFLIRLGRGAAGRVVEVRVTAAVGHVRRRAA
jgi:hypothetical protein